MGSGHSLCRLGLTGSVIEPCQRVRLLKPMTGTACSDFMDFVQALALQVETLKALPDRVQAMEARIAELEAIPRSGLTSPSSDLLGTWAQPNADKQQPEQQMQPTDLLGIETPPPAYPKPPLRQTPSPVPQQQRQPQQSQLGSLGSVSGVEQAKIPLCTGNLSRVSDENKALEKQAQRNFTLEEDPLILADPWASKSVPTSTTLQVKPPPPVVPGPRLQVKPPPTAVSGTLQVKAPPLAITKALQAARELVPGVSVDEATKAVPPPPVRAPPEALLSTSVESPLEVCREPASEVAVKQLPCKAPPMQLLLKAEQPPFKPPSLAEVVPEVATGVPKVPTKALPTKLPIKAPPPHFAR